MAQDMNERFRRRRDFGSIAQVIAMPNLIDVQRCEGGVRFADTVLPLSEALNQRLADHLPAKYALPADLRAATTEQVAFQRFQVENLEKIINGRVHRRDPC